MGLASASRLFLLPFCGLDWLHQPTFVPALVVGVLTVVFPFFLQPGMGLGVAASKTPRPNVARLRSLTSHAIFGVGLNSSGSADRFSSKNALN